MEFAITVISLWTVTSSLIHYSVLEIKVISRRKTVMFNACITSDLFIPERAWQLLSHPSVSDLPVELLSCCGATFNRPAADDLRYAHFLSPPLHSQPLSGTTIFVFCCASVWKGVLLAMWDLVYVCQLRVGQKNQFKCISLTYVGAALFIIVHIKMWEHSIVMQLLEGMETRYCSFL